VTDKMLALQTVGATDVGFRVTGRYPVRRTSMPPPKTGTLTITGTAPSAMLRPVRRTEEEDIVALLLAMEFMTEEDEQDLDPPYNAPHTLTEEQTRDLYEFWGESGPKPASNA